MNAEQPRLRWSVVKSSDLTYVTGPQDGLAWTYDVGEAFDIAHVIGGQVVNTDWFNAHWQEWRETGLIPEEAKSPKRGMTERYCPCPGCFRCCCKYVGLEPGGTCVNIEYGECVCERQ